MNFLCLITIFLFVAGLFLYGGTTILERVFGRLLPLLLPLGICLVIPAIGRLSEASPYCLFSNDGPIGFHLSSTGFQYISTTNGVVGAWAAIVISTLYTMRCFDLTYPQAWRLVIVSWLIGAWIYFVFELLPGGGTY